MNYVTYRCGPLLEEAILREYIGLNPGEVISRFVERQGREKGWPVLCQAASVAKQADAVLVIAVIGRLIRNTIITLILSESGVNFACCDIPNANERTIHILVALAERESQRVRQRTRDSLAAAKVRGVKLGAQRQGSPKGVGWKQAVAGSIRVRRQRTADAYRFILPEIQTRRERGDTLSEIATWLNQTGHVTTVGTPFTEVSVWRIIDRYLGKEWLGNNTRKHSSRV